MTLIPANLKARFSAAFGHLTPTLKTYWVPMAFTVGTLLALLFFQENLAGWLHFSRAELLFAECLLVPSLWVAAAQWNIPVLSFVGRYWLLLLLDAWFVKLSASENFYWNFGPLVFIPVCFTLAGTNAFIFRHIIFRDTLDLYVSSGQFTKEWLGLQPDQRIRYTLAVTCVFVLAACIVAASVGK